MNKKLYFYNFKDGYYSVGYEGEPKWFVPSLDSAIDVAQKILNHRVGLTSNISFRKLFENLTLQEYFSSSDTSR